MAETNVHTEKSADPVGEHFAQNGNSGRAGIAREQIAIRNDDSHEQKRRYSVLGFMAEF